MKILHAIQNLRPQKLMLVVSSLALVVTGAASTLVSPAAVHAASVSPQVACTTKTGIFDLAYPNFPFYAYSGGGFYSTTELTTSSSGGNCSISVNHAQSNAADKLVAVIFLPSSGGYTVGTPHEIFDNTDTRVTLATNVLPGTHFRIGYFNGTDSNGMHWGTQCPPLPSNVCFVSTYY